MQHIRVKGINFIDEDGNQVLFNGLCFICRKKKNGYLEPGIEDKLRFYSRHGFNLIRLGIFWDGVEPEPGKYDVDYLKRIEKIVEVAEQNGIYVFLDMHQDLFSVKYGDGAPIWATLDEGLYHPENCGMWYEAYLKSPAIIKAADNFWANKAAADGIGLLDHYERMWEYIAGKFKLSKNIIGFEPMNEPFMGSLAPQTFEMAVAKIKKINPDFDYTDIKSVTLEDAELMKNIMTEQFIRFDHDTLMPFYNRMLRAIRRVSPTAIITGGNIYCSSFVKTGLERVVEPEENIDVQQIYAPHGYDSVVDSNHYDLYNKENVRSIFEDKRASQEKLKLPCIVGEWGNFPSGSFTNDLIEFMNEILEKYLWSSTYHQYVAGMEYDKNYSSLERGYPVVIAGNLHSYHYDSKKRKLCAKWDAKENGSSLFYFPYLSAVESQDIVSTKRVKIETERLENSDGGYISIITYENGMTELSVN